jgi:hypothetical protein
MKNRTKSPIKASVTYPMRLNPVPVTLDGFTALSRYQAHKKGSVLRTDRTDDWTRKALKAALDLAEALSLAPTIEIEARGHFDGEDYGPEHVNIHVYSPKNPDVDVFFRGKIQPLATGSATGPS